MPISYSNISDPAEIEVLLNQKSIIDNFYYTYNQSTIELLKKNFYRPKSIYTLAKNGNAFAGFCSADTDWWEPNFYFLREIFVVPKYQKQKIGQAFVKGAINYAKLNKVKGIVTETDFNNIPMQKLCEKLGFKKWKNPQWNKGITYKLLFS